MGPEFQRLPRREDGRRVPPDDDTVVVLRRRRRRGSRATTAITVATAIPKAPHRLVVRLRQEIRRPAGCDLARVGPVG
jgi:ribosomal protein L14